MSGGGVKTAATNIAKFVNWSEPTIHIVVIGTDY